MKHCDCNSWPFGVVDLCSARRFATCNPCSDLQKLRLTEDGQNLTTDSAVFYSAP